MAETEAGAPSGEVGLSIIIPLYRDEAALEAIFERCRPILDAQPDGGELVLVDDGGLDRATPKAIAMAAEYPHPTTVVRLARNFGQHPAVFAGLAHARGRLVVTLDSDLQYAPEEIPKLVRFVSDEFPVVSGYREDRRDPMVRRWITRALTRWLNAQTKSTLRDFGSMFRVYDRATVDLMLKFTERHRYVPAVVAWLGVPIKEVPIAHAARSERGSSYRLSALVDMTMDLITGYSVFPLRVVTTLGLAASGAGFVGTVLFALYRILVGKGGAGTVSAFALIFLLLGVQLLITALMGEYVGRIYNEAKARPYYVVGELERVPGTRAESIEPVAS
jgi:undecaprenyl-phosphate 4-deoxy-4-formamido-L-arabinose transferase